MKPLAAAAYLAFFLYQATGILSTAVAQDPEVIAPAQSATVRLHLPSFSVDYGSLDATGAGDNTLAAYSNARDSILRVDFFDRSGRWAGGFHDDVLSQEQISWSVFAVLSEDRMFCPPSDPTDPDSPVELLFRSETARGILDADGDGVLEGYVWISEVSECDVSDPRDVDAWVEFDEDGLVGDWFQLSSFFDFATGNALVRDVDLLANEGKALSNRFNLLAVDRSLVVFYAPYTEPGRTKLFLIAPDGSSIGNEWSIFGGYEFVDRSTVLDVEDLLLEDEERRVGRVWIRCDGPCWSGYSWLQETSGFSVSAEGQPTN